MTVPATWRRAVGEPLVPRRPNPGFRVSRTDLRTTAAPAASPMTGRLPAARNPANVVVLLLGREVGNVDYRFNQLNVYVLGR
jgi:hypothetical protein